MKILIAPDSFKQSLSAKEAAAAISRGILKILPHAQITLAPISDGGEGFVTTLIEATNGRIIETLVHDALMRPIKSFFGVLGNDDVAVIEMAAASGLALLNPTEFDPLIASTFGTGELIQKALDLGFRKIILGIGGSATNDGGIGMARALGVRFLDEENKEIGQNQRTWMKISKIDVSGLNPHLKSSGIIAAVDVLNPLTGPKGATRVYAQQKGATPESIEILERNLCHYAAILRNQFDIEVEFQPGAGAGGGLAAGLVAFANAEIMSGFDVLGELIFLEEKIRNTDLVITGEGKMDRQTGYGKAPYRVASLASKHQKKVVAFTGITDKGFEELYEKGFDNIIPISPPLDLNVDVLKNASVLLQKAVEDYFGQSERANFNPT